MFRAAWPFLLLALPFLAVGATVSRSGMRRGGGSIRDPRPLQDSALRLFNVGNSLLLIGMVAVLIAVFRAADTLT